MRRRNNVSSFWVGAGLGVISGILVSRWMNRSEEYHDLATHSNEINMNKDEIAEKAIQFLKEEEKAEKQAPIH